MLPPSRRGRIAGVRMGSAPKPLRQPPQGVGPGFYGGPTPAPGAVPAPGTTGSGTGFYGGPATQPGLIGAIGSGGVAGGSASYGAMPPWDGAGSEGAGGLTGKNDSMTLEPDGMGQWSMNGGAMQPADAVMGQAGSWMGGPATAPGDATSAPIGAAGAGGEMARAPNSVPGPDPGPVNDGQPTYDMGHLGMMG